MDKVKNQKGIVLPPLLIWAVVIIGSILIGQDAVKKGYIEINLPSSEQVETVITTPSPEPTLIPIPPVKPTVAPTLKPVKPAYVDPDPIINCESSYPNCKGSSIKARKSQCSKITCCQIGGNWSIYPTTEKCSEDQKNYWSKVYSPSTGNSNLPPSEPLINCVLSYGTFQLRQSTCNDFKKSDGPPTEPLVDCQIITTYGDFSGKYTQADCDKLKIQASMPSTANTSQQYIPQYTSPTFPTPAPLMIQVEPEPCVVVPPGFGGATSGRVNEAGFPCAN